MLRWYDFVAVGIMANMISGVFLLGITAESMWTSFFSGVMLVMLHDICVIYGALRKIFENRLK